MVDKKNRDHSGEDDPEEIIEVLNPTIDNSVSAGDDESRAKGKLFSTVNLSGDNPDGYEQSELGKSFRSKDLSEEDLAGHEQKQEIEDQWLEEVGNDSQANWVKKLVILGVVFALFAGSWAFLNLRKQELAKEERSAELREKEQLLQEKVAKEMEQKENVLECTRGYLEASSIEERVKYCRNPESTLLKMRQYYNDKGEQAFDSYYFDGLAASFDQEILEREVTLIAAKVRKDNAEGKAIKKPKVLLLERQEDGTYRVDWELVVVYQPNNWDAFVASRNTEPHIFRLDVSESILEGPYLYHFSDDSEYQAYQIYIRGNAENYLLGYAKKDSEVDQKMKKLVGVMQGKIRKSKLIAPMTLELVFPKDAQSDQCVEIIEVVSETWFIP